MPRGVYQRKTIPWQNRFWSKVNKTKDHWLWNGKPDSCGYGVLNVNGDPIRAHVLSVRLSGRDIPKNMEIDHLCRVRICVKWDHLEVVTSKVNCLRGISPPAIHARKSLCINGHKFSKENTYVRKDNGGRQCRECRRERRRSRDRVFLRSSRR